MSEKAPLKITKRRQLKLCLLSCLVVWSLSSIFVFSRIEGGYQFPIFFGIISFFEALSLVPVLFAFYFGNQKRSFQRIGFLGVLYRISLGVGIGVLFGILQVFFSFRGYDAVQGLAFAASQGVLLGVLYSVFLVMGFFKDQTVKDNKPAGVNR